MKEFLVFENCGFLLDLGGLVCFIDYYVSSKVDKTQNMSRILIVFFSFSVSIAYLDPGNIESDLQSGAIGKRYALKK